MGISSVTNGSSATDVGAAADTQKAGSKAALDKDAFLKLLVAQMSHQDPLQPTEGTEFVTQLSQFAMVEQSIAQSTKLDTISTQMGGLSSNEAANLVGQTVGIRGSSSVTFDGVKPTSASVNLASQADKVTVQIQDGEGNTVRTMDVGGKPGGAMPITWDGHDDKGQMAPKGTYTVKVTAQTADGKAVSASTESTGKVTKVNFDKGYPEVQLDSGVTAPISNLVSVGGIVR